ncbi:sensor histidine kinase [Breznakia pachnodae]|uniref:histidine kinase n=1 Tax=Breznakia pachnodae TaxID=265178 RepID=A0ABU0DYN3_9FIRM|nr:sensor histidine kinase [Breznakia pachnodae]MDQ0359743.1 signal transduction histidine kinase [Breznakia pachnodae]
MKFIDYIKDRAYIILVNIICMLFAFFVLQFSGANLSILYYLLGLWIIVLFVTLGIGYHKQKKYFEELNSIMEQLDKKYLFVECMDEHSDAMSKEYYKLFKKMSKSMIGYVSNAENQFTEYKDYIESWIHEIKLPITAAKLIAENNKDETTRKILSQLELIDNSVERSLYYARSGVVENDYAIKETSLQQIVDNVISKNKQILMQNKVMIDCKDLSASVYTDEKWLGFILNQIMFNSIKYKSKQPVITFLATEVSNGVALHIKDNGIGVSASDLPRVFEKGFTGMNGRTYTKSTGIGLYLCRKLSKKLGIHISMESKENEYTEVILVFPKGTFVKV